MRPFLTALPRLLFVLLSSVFLLSHASAQVNQYPVISGTPATTAVVGQMYVFQPTASDPNGDPLTFKVGYKPSWLSFDTRTGRLSGVPTSANIGTYSSIKVMVNDGKLWASLPVFSIKVTSATASSTPTLSGTPPTTATVGAAYSFQPVALTSTGTLAFAIQSKPVWATFDTRTGRLTGTPAASNVGTFTNIRISVSNGSGSASLPAFTITVAAASTNRAPVLSGTPPTSVRVGTAYSFQPTASDPDGTALTFTIQNRPSWASFNAATGRLTGTPTAAQVGTYANIVIAASDGQRSTALPAFSINVTSAALGGAVLSWSPPTQNTDGSQLVNLSGYRIYYGSSPSALTSSVTINSAGITSYVVEGLTAGVWYFSIVARSSSGVESDRSTVVSKTIG